MKVLAILAMLIFILPTHGQEKAAHSEGQSQNSLDVSKTPPDGVTVTATNQHAPAENKQRPKDESQGYFRSLVSANNLPNIGLVIVGIVGILTAICTLHKIERQTAATEKNIVLQFRPKLSIRSMKLDISKALSKTQSIAVWRLVIANIGSSPAHIKPFQIVFDSFVQDIGKNEIYDLGTEGIDSFTLAAGEIRVLDSNVTNARDHVLVGKHFSDTSFGQYVWIRCTGVILFVDDVGIQRRIGFRRKFDAKTEELIPDSDPEYEYDDET